MAVPLGELELSGTSVARDLCPSAFSFGASCLFWTFFALVIPSLYTVLWVTFTLSCVSISYSPGCVGAISKRRRGGHHIYASSYCRASFCLQVSLVPCTTDGALTCQPHL